MKKTQFCKQRNYSHKYKEVKEKRHPNSFIYVSTIFEHQVEDMYAYKKIQVFLVFAVQKHICGTRGATNEQVYYQAPLTLFKTQILKTGSRTSKDS